MTILHLGRLSWIARSSDSRDRNEYEGVTLFALSPISVARRLPSAPLHRRLIPLDGVGQRSRPFVDVLAKRSHGVADLAQLGRSR